MLHARILGGLGIAFLLAACSSTTTNNGGVTQDGGSSGDGGTGGGALSFKPSNIDLTGWDLSQIGDVDLSGTNCIIDDEAAEGLTSILCDTNSGDHVVHKIVTLADQSKISIYVMKSLRIEPSTSLSLSRGHLPIVLVTTGSMEVLGSIDVLAGLVGGAFNSGIPMELGKGSGAGGGTAGDSTGLAGGGGSFCGLGGKAGTITGATPGTAAPAPTAAYGNATLVPLTAGSAGGNGALVNDGQGGGAVQLVAGTSFNLHAGGHINAGGSGGTFGGTTKQSSGGGGSGGAILIESPTVNLDGAVGANGGGGGQGNGDTGDDAKADVIAKGGHKVAPGAAGDPAGDGSFGAALNGGDGPSSPTFSAGGGGGGAGRIRVNTTSGAATITGAISPAAGSACFTQGKLAS